MKHFTDYFRTNRGALMLSAFIIALAVAGHLFIKRISVSAAPPPMLTIEVTTSVDENNGTPDPGTGSGTSLREAIEAANLNPGDDTITFAAGVTGQSFLISSLPALDSNITITGPGANVLTIRRATGEGDGRGGENFRIFTINAGKTVVLSGLTISDGNDTSGGGIANFGNLTVNGFAVSGNTATSGGGIFNSSGATLTVNNSTISGNTVGGGIFNQGSLTVSNSTISGNTASGSGGGINNSSVLTVKNSTVAGNTAGSSGGGVSSTGTFNLSSTILAKNSAASGPDVSGTISSADYNLIQTTSGWSIITDGGHNISGTDPLLELSGGIPLLKDNGGTTRTIALLAGSPAIDKGTSNGLATDQRGSPRILDNPVIANAAGGDGADIGAFENQTALLRVTTTDDHNDGSCTSGDCTLREAINAGNASTISVDIDFAPGVTGTINLGSALPALNNSLNILGPGANVLTVRRDTGGNYRIFTINAGKTVTISGLTISNGNDTSGGGIANFGALTLGSSAVSGNTATSGGGVFNSSGTLNVNNSTISGNSATNGGGLENASTLIVTNSTIAGNTATGNGGGINNSSVLTVKNSTVAGNTAGGSGGGVNSASTFNLSSTILAKNSAASGPDVSGTIDSADFSLIETTTGWTITFDGGHNISGTDPLLELSGGIPLLQNNGGPTQTIALLCFSPAIDAGTSNGLTTDQRGLSRVFDDTVVANAFDSDATDIGAFERQQSCNNAPVALCKGSVTLTAVEGCSIAVSPADLDNGSFDPDSGDTISFSASPSVLPVGGPFTVTLTVADNHENASTCMTQVTVVETTPPVARCMPATVFLDEAGQARVDFRSIDDESSDNCAIVSRTVSPDTFTCANIGPNTVTLTVTDASGNQSSCTTTVTVIDNIAPVARCKNNFSVNLGPGGTASITAADINDNSSDNCSIASISVSPSTFNASNLGSNIVTLTVIDPSGNQSTCTSNVAVLYNFTGFFNPIGNPPVLNEAKAGQAIPIKFSLNGNQGLNIFAPGFPASVEVACISGAPISVIEETITAGSSSLSYDATTDQYIYVWKTDKAWAGTCRRLLVQLKDGSLHVANFRFK